MWKLGMLREVITILLEQEGNVTAEGIHKYCIVLCSFSEEYLLQIYICYTFIYM
jgi:hypothetical protein